MDVALLGVDGVLPPVTHDFSALADAFSARIHELKKFTHLRVDDRTLESGTADLAGLEASIKGLESQVNEVRAYLQSESSNIPKVEALIGACQLQSEDIAGLATALHPALCAGMARSGGPLSRDIVNDTRRDEDRVGKRTARAAMPAPRWHVTKAEFSEIGQYMRGRLTLEKVNTAIDEIGGHADAMQRLLTTPLSKLSVTDRAKATELLHSIAKRDGVQGRHFFLEHDLREGTTLRLDKTGRSIMVLLRHLGRVQEVRATLVNQPCLVYVVTPHA